MPADEGPAEHRTYREVVYPANQFGEARRDYQTRIGAGVAQRGDGPPLVHVTIETDRRSITVALTLSELLQLTTNLWTSAAAVKAVVTR